MASHSKSVLPFLAVLACGPGKDEADCYEGFERDFEGNCVASSGSQEESTGSEPDAGVNGDGSTNGDGQPDSGQPGGGSDEADGNLGGLDDGTATDADPGGLADETGGAGGTTGMEDTGSVGGSGGDPTGGGGVAADPCEGRPVGTTVGSCAADFTLVNHEGLEVRLKDFAGDVIVLDLSSFT